MHGQRSFQSEYKYEETMSDTLYFDRQSLISYLCIRGMYLIYQYTAFSELLGDDFREPLHSRWNIIFQNIVAQYMVKRKLNLIID